MITAGLVKELREKTGAGMMDCKKALEETSGDIEKATDFLRKKGIARAAKRAGRQVSEGLVHSYIHPGGKVGVLIEMNCETDFVARTEDFQALVNDVAMHIAAAAPRYLTADEVPQADIERERDVLKSQAEAEGKPAQVVEKIVEGRINKFYSEHCLLKQSFIKNPDVSIEDLLKETIGKLGENITVKRYARYQLGDQ